MIAKASASAPAATPDLTVAWLTFWADVAQALAWPIAAVILALFFATPLRRVLQKIVEFEGLGVKATFAKDVEQLAHKAASVELEGQAVLVDSGGEADEALVTFQANMARSRNESPASIIISAFAQLESALRQTAKRLGHAISSTAGVTKIAGGLARRGDIPRSLEALISDAQGLRGRVAYGEDISFTEALAFRAAIQDIVQLLSAHAAKSIARAAGAK